MSERKTYPKIAGVSARPGKRLLVRFKSGEARLYDCAPLLRKPVFRPLRNETLFRKVRADPHGYGVVWTDELDLAESEIWLHGRPVEALAGMVREAGDADELPSGRRRTIKYPTTRKQRK